MSGFSSSDNFSFSGLDKASSTDVVGAQNNLFDAAYSKNSTGMNDQLNLPAVSNTSDVTMVALDWGSFGNEVGNAIKGAGDAFNSATEAVQEFVVEPIRESASQVIRDTLGSVENSDNQTPQVQPPSELTRQIAEAAETVVNNVKVQAEEAQKNILGFTQPLSNVLSAATKLVLPSENTAVSEEPLHLGNAGIAGTLSMAPTLALPAMAPVARVVSTVARVAGPYAAVAGVTQYFINEGIKLDGEAKTAESSALQAQMDARVMSTAYDRGMTVTQVGDMMAGRPVIAKQPESGIVTSGAEAMMNSTTSLASEAQKLVPLKAEVGPEDEDEQDRIVREKLEEERALKDAYDEHEELSMTGETDEDWTTRKRVITGEARKEHDDDALDWVRNLF